MFKTISATEANRRFSEILRLVSEGETYIVTTHGRPRVRMEPVGDMREPEGPRTRLRNLEGQAMPRWPADATTNDEERERAHHEFMDFLRTLPALNIGPWTRDELYEDEWQSDE